jgi:hypothetical protein
MINSILGRNLIFFGTAFFLMINCSCNLFKVKNSQVQLNKAYIANYSLSYESNSELTDSNSFLKELMFAYLFNNTKYQIYYDDSLCVIETSFFYDSLNKVLDYNAIRENKDIVKSIINKNTNSIYINYFDSTNKLYSICPMMKFLYNGNININNRIVSEYISIDSQFKGVSITTRKDIPKICDFATNLNLTNGIYSIRLPSGFIITLIDVTPTANLNYHNETIRKDKENFNSCFSILDSFTRNSKIKLNLIQQDSK